MNTYKRFEVPPFEALLAAALRALYQMSQNHVDETESLKLLPGIMMAIIEHPDSKNHQLLVHVCWQLYIECASLFSSNYPEPKELH